MASITIRKLDDKTKTRLRVRAAQNGRSMEEEARTLLRSALQDEITPPGSLADAIRARFRRLRRGRAADPRPRADPRVPEARPMIILDTNVLSELMRPDPAQKVVAWVASQPTASLFTTSITQAEILLGLMLLPLGRRRRALEAAATSMFEEDFGGRILGFGTDAAPRYAQIASDRRRAGRPISRFDAQIAAIARLAGAALATRNLGDFEGCGLSVVNPWEA